MTVRETFRKHLLKKRNATPTGSMTMHPPSPPASFDLFSYLKEKRLLLDGYLEKILQQLNFGSAANHGTKSRIGNPVELVQAMKHSLMAGGKRLRPVLAMASAEACGGDSLLALPAACAIEMIHTYSLIHDDLPAMDDDDLRRGLPTCHRAFSEATAILAGDALLTHAFTVLTDPEALTIFPACPDKSILFDLVTKISHAAGPYGMVQGQMMDMQAEGVTEQDQWKKKIFQEPYSGKIEDEIQTDGPTIDPLTHLEQLHRMKTGRMIVVSVESGAISVGADKEEIHSLVGYAEKIGLAFQVTDDILNVEGDPDVMGKAAGSDASNDKMTYPALMGLDASKAFARQLLLDAKQRLEPFGEKALPLHAIADYILERKR